MDIIDILVARALTPQGQIDTYAARARQAVTNSNTAITNANTAINNISTITEQTNANNQTAAASASAANQALEDANSALSAANTAIENIDSATTSAAVNEIKKLALSLVSVPANDNTSYNLKTTYPDNTISTIENIVRYYTTTGQNTNGTMTQKAITDALDTLDNKINNINGSGSGASINFDAEDAGKIVVVGEDGGATTGKITEDDITEAFATIGIYKAKDAVGILIDYENRTFERIQEASASTNFNKYPMYQRCRCNVNSNGRIVAWDGDANFKSDGTNGDVMVYQPKFYYQRIPIKVEDGVIGKIIRKESLSVSATAQTGFKIHPAFVDINGNILDYILLPAYESCYYDTSANQLIKDDSGVIDFSADVLRSCADAKPITGHNHSSLNSINAEQLAANHGAGWHITNAAAESVTQMLAMIEFGTMNGQTALESGLSNIPNNDSYNCASQTGSTASNGNSSGVATQTTNITNGVTNVYSEPGRRAVTYRGMENPWGNTWRFVGGLNVYGDGASQGGIPYVCTNFNYNTSQLTENYENVGFCLPQVYDWISAMGYGNEKYDWLFMPAEATGANSALPVGDNLWTIYKLNALNIVTVGGPWQHQDNNGLFYYSCDNKDGAYRTVSARLMHIPTYNSAIATQNYTDWRNKEAAENG